jgi:ketosteroid isomerase-like protein
MDREADINQMPGHTTKRQRNIASVTSFYEYFVRDKARFLALWSDNPVVEIPFIPPGIPRFYKTKAEFLGFWDPIFEYKGKFDWKILELIVGENPDEIVAITESDVDAMTPLGRRQYQGSYLQIFRFDNGKISLFREYVDTAFMTKIYGDFGAS